jgi:hypothetical protein
LQYASENLRAERELVMVALATAGSALQFASDTLRADSGVVLAAARQNIGALRWAKGRTADLLQAGMGLLLTVLFTVLPSPVFLGVLALWAYVTRVAWRSAA